MQVCFIRDGVSLVMPVTPERYQWTSGKRIETININELGDVYRPAALHGFPATSTFCCLHRITRGSRRALMWIRSIIWTI